jgi:hypothetical protein
VYKALNVCLGTRSMHTNYRSNQAQTTCIHKHTYAVNATKTKHYIQRATHEYQMRRIIMINYIHLNSDECTPKQYLKDLYPVVNRVIKPFLQFDIASHLTHSSVVSALFYMNVILLLSNGMKLFGKIIVIHQGLHWRLPLITHFSWVVRDPWWPRHICMLTFHSHACMLCEYDVR